MAETLSTLGEHATAGSGPRTPALLMLVRTFALIVASACAAASKVEVDPDIEHLPALAEVGKNVGVQYPQAFRDKLYTARSSDGERQSYAVGAASTRVLRDVFAKVFRRAVELRAGEAVQDPALEAVFVPELRSVSIALAPPLAGRWWFVWGRMRYRFTVTSPQGEPITAWDVIGSCETIGDARSETLETVTPRILSRCIEDAGIRFMRSFYDIPEAERWARNLVLAEADAPADGLFIEPPKAAEPLRVAGLYRGVVRVEAQPLEESPRVYRLSVENLGGGSLLVEPLSIALEAAGETIDRVPVYAYAAAQLPRQATASRHPPYIPPPPISLEPRYFGIFHLIYALEVLAAMETEQQLKQRFDGELEKFRGSELREQRLAKGAATTGDVHFLSVANKPFAGAIHLVIPIIDLKAARRYRLRLPIPPQRGAKP